MCPVEILWIYLLRLYGLATIFLAQFYSAELRNCSFARNCRNENSLTTFVFLRARGTTRKEKCRGHVQHQGTYKPTLWGLTFFIYSPLSYESTLLERMGRMSESILSATCEHPPPARVARALQGDEVETTRLIKCSFQHKTSCLETDTNKNHGGVANTEAISSKALSEIIQHISVNLY